MDRVLLYLDVCMSPDERKLTEIIDARGGPQAVMRNKNLLRELFDSRETGRESRGPDGAVDEFKALQDELQKGVQTTVHENMVQFQETFASDLQRQLEALQGAMHDEGNRIIAAVTYGPHEKINDPVSHRIY